MNFRNNGPRREGTGLLADRSMDSKECLYFTASHLMPSVLHFVA